MQRRDLLNAERSRQCAALPRPEPERGQLSLAYGEAFGCPATPGGVHDPSSAASGGD